MQQPAPFRLASAPCLLAIGAIACSAPTGKVSDGGLADPNHSACSQPGDMGNELKVGEYCVEGAATCTSNNIAAGDAYICTLDGDPTSPEAFCTKACTWNGVCGTNAVCVGSGATGPKGCVPTACTDDPGVTSVPDGGSGPADAGPVTDAGAPDAGPDADGG